MKIVKTGQIVMVEAHADDAGACRMSISLDASPETLVVPLGGREEARLAGANLYRSVTVTFEVEDPAPSPAPKGTP